MLKIKALIVLSFLFSVVSYSQSQYIIDMVHHNPGEPLTKTDFSDPFFVKKMPFNGQVMNDFIFAHTAIPFKKVDSLLFPIHSPEYKWIKDAANTVLLNIKQAHKAGLKAYYFTDLIVLPKKIVEKYNNQLCDEKGKISFEKPFTVELHRLMLRELFETFPDLDGLVIRTGETYLNNVPYHTGNNPITNGEESHVKLINILREEVCEKLNKTIFYRTWSIGGLHDSLPYYLHLTNRIKPHKNLIFSIKHTQGDYHRTYGFNPCIGKGIHPQIIEIQCQREYEGKGAYPNYVMNGVINGFEENPPNSLYQGLKDIKNLPNFKGIYTWSRGGGWKGPYITNEFWCKLNAYVASNWAANHKLTEQQVFNKFMVKEGIKDVASQKAFRKLCLLSAKAVVRGHASASLPFKKNWVFWMRDHFLAGSDSNTLPSKYFPSEGFLFEALNDYQANNQLDAAIKEKYESMRMWDTIVGLSKKIKTGSKINDEYIKVSSLYGYYLHSIIASGWKIMADGLLHDKQKSIDKIALKQAFELYDASWEKFKKMPTEYKQCATLYLPFAFTFTEPEYHMNMGMDASVNKYRYLIK